MAPRTRKPKEPDTIVPDEQVEILPRGRGLVLDWRVIAPTVALGTVTGFAASLVVGGGGLLRHAVVGLLGMLVGQGLVRLTGWRASTTWRWRSSAPFLSSCWRASSLREPLVTR